MIIEKCSIWYSPIIDKITILYEETEPRHQVYFLENPNINLGGDKSFEIFKELLGYCLIGYL